MSQHYTRNTLGDTVYCNKCQKKTLHAVSGRVLGHCIPCFDRRQAKEAVRKTEEAARKAIADAQPAFAFAERSPLLDVAVRAGRQAAGFVFRNAGALRVLWTPAAARTGSHMDVQPVQEQVVMGVVLVNSVA